MFINLARTNLSLVSHKLSISSISNVLAVQKKLFRFSMPEILTQKLELKELRLEHKARHGRLPPDEQPNLCKPQLSDTVRFA